eukprot:240106_1
MAFELHNKYIKNGSEFEINVSYQQRTEVSDVLADYGLLVQYNMSLVDLYKLFTESVSEMYTLLTFSLSRFRSEESFTQVVASLKDARSLSSNSSSNSERNIKFQ